MKKYLFLFLLTLLFSFTLTACNSEEVPTNNKSDNVIEEEESTNSKTENVTEDDILYGLEWEYFTYQSEKCINITGYNGIDAELIIPESIDGITVRKISSYCFLNKTNLISISIPNTVEIIEEAAFANCTNLTRLVLPEGLTSVAKGLFLGCKKLTYVYLPSSITTIESYAFYGCSSLPSVIIPNEVSSLGDYLFTYSGLQKIYFSNSINTISTSAFDSKIDVYYSGTLEEWKSIEYSDSYKSTQFTKKLFLKNMHNEWINTHIFEYSHSDSKHWKICVYCGYSGGTMDDHEYIDGKCVCGLKETIYYYRQDLREKLYGVYDGNNQLLTKYASLYQAINYCVNNCDDDGYVAKDSSNEKLFVNYSKYTQGNADMFWYYSNVTTLAEYSAWKSNYWTEFVKNGDYICVFKNSVDLILEPHANSYEIVKTIGTVESEITPVYNVCWDIETSVTVKPLVYSGITKQVYKLNLSESKIYPSYNGTDQAWPYIGFMTSDNYNTSHQGIRCDTTTGNWYYYSGEVVYNNSEIQTNTSECILTSTLDKKSGCWKPDQDVVLIMELLTITDDFGDRYIIHRFTIELEDGESYSWDYELGTLTQCATIYFTCGLDIESTYDFPDYMNGGKFTNLIVTSAKGYVLEEIANGTIDYGEWPNLGAGEYDLLNSNPASGARFQTIVYTPTCISYDFNTPGVDVYSFTFDTEIEKVPDEPVSSYEYEGTSTYGPYFVYNEDGTQYVSEDNEEANPNNSLFNAIRLASSISSTSNKAYVLDANGLMVFQRQNMAQCWCFDGTNFVGVKERSEALKWAKGRERSYVIDGQGKSFITLGIEYYEESDLSSFNSSSLELFSGGYNYMFSTSGTDEDTLGFGYMETYCRLSEASYMPNLDTENRDGDGWNAYIFINAGANIYCDLGLIGVKKDNQVVWVLVRNCQHSDHNNNPAQYGYGFEVISWNPVTTMTWDEEARCYNGADDLYFQCWQGVDGWVLRITNLRTNEIFEIDERHEGMFEGHEQDFRFLLAVSYCPTVAEVWNARCGAFLRNVVFDGNKLARYVAEEFTYEKDFSNSLLDFYPGENMSYGYSQAADCASSVIGTRKVDGTYKSGNAYYEGDKYISFSTYYDGGNHYLN